MTAHWSAFDKAEWILKNGKPDIKWVYERALDITYRRPSEHLSTNLPPWINKERQPIQQTHGDKDGHSN